MLLASARRDLVAALTLVEPAALSLSAGAPRTMAHIAALAPVFAVAGNGATVRAFPGTGHRPHDQPAAGELMVRHWLRVEAQT